MLKRFHPYVQTCLRVTFPTKKYTPPELTSERLNQLALRYVSRYAASRAMLERVLKNHVTKYVRAVAGVSPVSFTASVRAILDKAEKLGWVNDRELASAILREAKRAGFSKQKTAQKLYAKGIGREMANDVLAAHFADADEEAQAALIFARAKKLGPYNPKRKADDMKTIYKKDLAKLCRAGFPLSIARKVMKGEVED